MTLAAFEPFDIAQVDGVLERPVVGGDRSASIRLTEDRVADIAVIPDKLARRAYVLPVMASEASLRIEVAYVIRVSLPVRLHLREIAGPVNPLDFVNGLLD